MKKRLATQRPANHATSHAAKCSAAGGTALAAAALLYAPTGAQAQTVTDTAAPMKLEEIVVTATKREESSEKVPISVQAYTQDRLDKDDVKQFSDIARLTPGVTFDLKAGGNGNGNNVAIRGISSGTGAATVGVYIDETPVQVFPDSLSSTNPYPKVFDLERVEILRGPQGTLFGAGSEGGTIRFITPDPSLTKYSSYVRSDLSTTQGGDPSYEFGAAGGGPIVDDVLGFRVSAWYRRDGGYVDHILWSDQRLVGRNANWDDSKVVRAALKWQPASGLNVTASVFYQATHQNDSPTYWEYYSNPSRDQFVNANPLVTPANDKFTLPAIKVNWDMGPVTLVSNTSYLSRANDNEYDSTTLDIASFGIYNGMTPPQALWNYYSPAPLTDTQNVFTQEIRLQSNKTEDSRFSWLAGIFIQHSRQNQTYFVQNTFINDELGYVHPGLTVQDIFGFGLYQDKYLLYSSGGLTQKEQAFFGDVDWRATEKLTLTAGVRVAHHTFDELTFGAGPVVSSNGAYTPSSQNDTPVTPKYVISYQLDKDNMVYGSAAKGYRQGFTTPAIGSRCQQDADALGISTSQREIKPDFVWSYELGSKNRLGGGRVQLDSSLYYINWRQIQSNLTLPDCQVPTTFNSSGGAVSKGFDFGISVLATDHLEFTLTGGYADARYTSDTKGGNNNIIRSSGQPLDIPPWQGSFSGQYDFVAFEHKSYLRLTDQVQSHDSTELDPHSAATDPNIPRAPSSNNLGARLGTTLNGWDISLYGDNLTNEHPEYSRYHDQPSSPNYRGITIRPRTIGITGVYRY